MSFLKSILGGVREGDHMASINLTEAYLHTMIFPDHWRCLRFSYLGINYPYRALPFGLALAPSTFTKVLVVVATHLRTVPVRIQCYLDDILVQALSPRQTQSDTYLTISTFQAHGFSVNFEKSSLSPATRLLHLGAVIDAREGKVFLSLDRKDSLVQLMK